MKFRAKTEDMTKALGMVSVVTPKPLTNKDAPVYLFSVRGDRCFVYSRDQYRVARSSFPISDVEGEGPFTYPSSGTDSFRYVGEYINIETLDGPEEWSVKYTSESGAKGERTTLDPRMTSPCDRELDSAVTDCEFPAAILREGIAMGRTFLAKANESTSEEQYKTLQVFDKSRPEWEKGDGHMFASDSKSAYYFYCSAFEGKHLDIHSEHLPQLISFLAKCDGNVTLRRGTNHTFIEDVNGDVLGWTHHSKTHGKFAYYGTSKENYVFNIDKNLLQRALMLTRNELEAKRDKIKMHFDHVNETLQFKVSEGNSKSDSFPVVCAVKQKLNQDFTINANIDRLINLIEGVKGNVVVLRFLVMQDAEKKTENALMRTVDEFRLDSNGKVSLEAETSFLCRVTRFSPSK